MKKEDQKTFLDQDLQTKKKQIMREIESELLHSYPLALKKDQNGEYVFRDLKEIESLMNQNLGSERKTNVGRGGNNVSQNIKKSIRSLLMKYLSKPIFEEYEERYIKRYNLKSQKQNYILYFLFLFELKVERKVTDETIQGLVQEIRKKIEKYASNSEQRMKTEPERREFHQKNLIQFRKFLEINLNFDQPRRYEEIKGSIKTLYLKKQAVYVQAEKKVRKILKEHPVLSQIFIDWEEQAEVSPLNSDNQENEQLECESSSYQSS